MPLRTATSGLECGPCYPPRSVKYLLFAGKLMESGRISIHSGTYYARRLNHLSRASYIGLDGGKGEDSATIDCAKGFPADGTIEKLERTSDRKYRYRYTEGPEDKAFMEQKDREYLMALKDSDDPAMQARFEEEFATLDLSLEHHRNLKREFEPFTWAYREAVGGGGEGGGPQPPAADAASTLPEQRDASPLFRGP